MQHVPYRGSAPAITDLVAGHVDLLADNLLSGMQHVKSGRLKIIGTGGATRLQAYPKVATFGEILPGFISDTWMAVSAPPNTPQPIVMTLSRAIAQVLQMPHVKKRIEELQAEPVGDRPDKMAALIRESEIRWSPIIKDAQIRGD
jgi:tripartite-type tricarboxylate transporter receptor subunit TctC